MESKKKHGSAWPCEFAVTLTAVFIIYPLSIGRNFDEVLRALDALQLSAKHQISTPVNWKPGDDVVVPSSMPEEVTKQKFPGGLKVFKPYLRTGAQPK